MKINNENYIVEMCKIRLKRKKLKISIKQVAEYLGISRSAISQYEALRATLSETTIKRYKDYLNMMESCKEK